MGEVIGTTHIILDNTGHSFRRQVKKQGNIYYITYEGNIWIVDYLGSQPVFEGSKIRSYSFKLNRIATLS